MYLIKKRIQALEEIMHEALIVESSLLSTSLPVHEVVQNQVLHLYKQGISIDQIAQQSALSKNKVLRILESQVSDLF